MSLSDLSKNEFWALGEGLFLMGEGLFLIGCLMLKQRDAATIIIKIYNLKFQIAKPIYMD